jgi:hypothetical protein
MGQVYSTVVVGMLNVTGSSAMPHFGQEPGPGCLTSGCMGQVYSIALLSAEAGVC